MQSQCSPRRKIRQMIVQIGRKRFENKIAYSDGGVALFITFLIILNIKECSQFSPFIPYSDTPLLLYLNHFYNFLMASSYAFAFPKPHHNAFRLLVGSTVGYLSDAIFYRLDLHSGKAEALHHPDGRTYQAFAALHKRGMTVLADYGKSSNLYFYFTDASRNFQIRNVCPLEILALELSLDGRYLAVACGSPTFRVVVVDVEERVVVGGSQSFIDLREHSEKFLKMEFNPANRRQLALLLKDKVQIYELKDCVELTERGVEKGLIVLPRNSMTASKFQSAIWDQLGNMYLAADNRLWVWSTETGSELASYDVQVETDDTGDSVRALQLTPKHIIAFYSSGRTEWLIKFYPELLDEDSTSKPFQLDKFHESTRKVVHAIYDHHFTKLLLAYDDGFMGVLEIPAEDNRNEQEQDEGDRRKKAKETKKIEVEGSIIGPYHRKGICLIRQIQGTSLAITVSLGGRVILWSGLQRRQLGYFDAEGDITCADINSKANVLAIGTSDGLIQFYSISSFSSPFLFREIRLTRGNRIHQIEFSSTSEQLAVLCRDEDRVYYLLTNNAMAYEVLGYVSLPHHPLYIAWNKTQRTAIKPKHELLLVSIGYGVLSINGPQAVPAKRRGDELNLTAQIYALRTDIDQNFVCALSSGEILTSGEDKFIKKYRQPEELIAKVDFRSKQPIPPPLEQIDAHDLRVVCWESGAKWLVSGGADGTVQLREAGNLSAVRGYKVAGWKQESLSSVAFSSKGGIYAGSHDGCFQVWRIEGTEVLPDEHKVEEVSFKRIGKDRSTKYFEVMVEEEYLERMKDVITGKKKIQLEKLAKIKAELNHLLYQNQKHDELERLNRDEFAIDLESRERVAAKGREKCQQIREQSRVKILRNEVLARKLKQLTWDRMEVQLKAVNGLKNSFIVFNYQMRRISKEEKRTLQILFDLRRAQKKQQKRRTPDSSYDFYINKNVVNGGVVQPLIMTGGEREQKKEQKGKKKKEQEVAVQAEAAEEVFNQEEWSLLYNSFQLFTDNAKRNQIILMKHMMIRIKEAFNRQFEKVLKLRQNQNQIINDKNKRIEEITEELKKGNETLRGRKNVLETNEDVLEVSPSEIPFSRYLSKEQREKAERQRLKQEQRLRKLAEDDSSLRALGKMMGGTLQEKKTSVLEVTVEREKWMEKPAEEMSEEQKSKLKEFQQKRQKAQEEKERIVKKLEAELRKLRQEIDDIMQRYDEKLFALIKRRLEYDYRLEEQELYCTRLYLSIAVVREQQSKQGQLQQRLESSKARLQKMSEQREALAAEEEQAEHQKQAKHAALDSKKLGDIESKIKTIEKSIFQQYGTNFKKRREMEEKLLEADPTYRNLLVPLDPLKDIESKNLAAEKARDFHFFTAEIKVLQQTYDIPEASLLQILEARFNIRREEAELDTRVKVLKETLALSQQRRTKGEEDLGREEGELTAINDFLKRAESDLEVQVRIKQGQVELNSDKPVPELEFALLIARGEIEEKNTKIRLNADEKIKVMQMIKTCKISVTEQTLNLQKKEELIQRLNSMIKQIQMLKVKKEMQVALAKKDTKLNENEVKSLKEQIEKVRKEGDKRIALFEKKIEKVAGEVDTIRKENKTLETQKWNLEETVKQREKIKEMMVGENGEGDQEAKEKFQQIAINRKLFDRAKQQTEEIELLREELSKLKAKTFANFSNAQR